MRHDPPPIVRREAGRPLIDRASLARLSKRSARTIREHCPVVDYARDGRALYDAEQCRVILAAIPTRQRSPACADVVQLC